MASMDAEIMAMLRARERAERRRGVDPPRRRLTTEARVAYRAILNAPALQEVLRSMGGDVDILVHGYRATQHVLRRCAEEEGIETIDGRLFELEGGVAAHMPRHTLLAPAGEADEWMAEHLPHIAKEALPFLRADDPAALYFGCQVGELWSCGEDEDEEAQTAGGAVDGGATSPPRLVVD